MTPDPTPGVTPDPAPGPTPDPTPDPAPGPTPGVTPGPITVLVDAVRVRELTTRVLPALEDVGAMPLVFKGAALAHTHYDASWQRPRADTDVLIADRARTQVSARLLQLGYERPTFISGDFVMYQEPFIRTDHLGIEHVVDVHWRIGNPQVVAHVVTHPELAMRSVVAMAHGTAIRVPSAVDALLIACVHRAAHHEDSEDPVWIDDIHRLATTLSPSEWHTVVERASAWSVRTLCARGINLARHHCGTRVPPEVLTALTTQHREPSAVFLRHGIRPLDRLVSDVRALGPSAAVRLLREHLFPPAAYVQAAYGVRLRALLPAYYVLRVVRGVSRWSSRRKHLR